MKAGLGPVQVSVTGEDIDRTVSQLSKFNPMVVVAVIFALTLVGTQIGSMIYLEIVIAPENARVIGEKMSVLSEAISSVAESNHEQVQSLIVSHDSHIKQLVDSQKDQTALLREVISAVHGKVATASKSNGGP